MLIESDNIDFNVKNSLYHKKLQNIPTALQCCSYSKLSIIPVTSQSRFLWILFGVVTAMDAVEDGVSVNLNLDFTKFPDFLGDTQEDF